MKIQGGSNGPQRPTGPQDARQRDGVAPDGARPATGTPARTDRVEISSEGRARAATAGPLEEGSLSRLDQVRQRILSGAYDSDAVVAEVARRIMDRGDV
jgi:hypothetical protein